MTHSPFPECVKALGHALAPLSQRIHAVLTESQQRSVLDQSSIERVGNALDKLQEQIEALETIINHDFTALVECTVDEGVLNAHRIAGKLESTLGTMLVAYRRYDGSDEPSRGTHHVGPWFMEDGDWPSACSILSEWRPSRVKRGSLMPLRSLSLNCAHRVGLTWLSWASARVKRCKPRFGSVPLSLRSNHFGCGAS